MLQERFGLSATDAVRTRLGAMANLLYAGQTIPLQETVNVEELADLLLDAYAKGGYSWLWADLKGASPERVRLMIGPGIPIAIVDGRPRRQSTGEEGG